jgi:CHAT domain-containing protein
MRWSLAKSQSATSNSDERKSSGSVLVELFHFRDQLRIFLLRPDSAAPEVLTRRLSVAELDKVVDGLADLTRPGDHWITDAWEKLSDLICPPLGSILGDSDRVIFVPHRIFHYLPLHLLLFDRRVLIESHAVAYSPSASVLRYCRQKNPKRADPSFRPITASTFGLDFEEEAELVAHYFKSATIFTKTNSVITSEAVCSACRNVDVIHFSGHGTFEPDKPDETGLVLPFLSGVCPKVLSLRDVYCLDLRSYLVALGACVTAVGKYASGDEILGITRGFLYAGTPTVLASLWPVPDRPTLMLMNEFYSHLVNSHLDKADSLRLAQMQVRKSFSSPSEWAGFVVIGDWL